MARKGFVAACRPPSPPPGRFGKDDPFKPFKHFVTLPFYRYLGEPADPVLSARKDPEHAGIYWETIDLGALTGCTHTLPTPPPIFHR